MYQPVYLKVQINWNNDKLDIIEIFYIIDGYYMNYENLAFGLIPIVMKLYRALLLNCWVSVFAVVVEIEDALTA